MSKAIRRVCRREGEAGVDDVVLVLGGKEAGPWPGWMGAET